MSFIQQENKIFGIVDANNFYVSCEQAFNPKLKNKPVIVLSNNDGCVISRSQEAKDLGIKMGQPFFEIKDLVEKHKVYVCSSNFTLYSDMSYRFHEILSMFFPEIEIYSVDESFLDLTSLRNYDLYSYLKSVKEEIYKWIKIPTCIGVGRTKTLAKLANEYAKKNKKTDGIYIALDKKSEEEILKNCKVEDIWGIGKKTSKFLKKNYIYTPYNFIQQNDYWIRKNLKITGLKTLYELKGISCIKNQNNYSKAKKNTIISRSFAQPITELQELESVLITFCIKLAEKLTAHKQVTQYLGLYLRSNPFSKKEKYYSNYSIKELAIPTNSIFQLKENSFELLKKIYKKNIKFKKMGLYALNLMDESLAYQLNLFESNKNKILKNSKKILFLIHNYNTFDNKKILFAKNLLYESNTKKNKIYISKKYTTNIKEIVEVYIK